MAYESTPKVAIMRGCYRQGSVHEDRALYTVSISELSVCAAMSRTGESAYGLRYKLKEYASLRRSCLYHSGDTAYAIYGVKFSWLKSGCILSKWRFYLL
jgi:hypothetical protein